MKTTLNFKSAKMLAICLTVLLVAGCSEVSLTERSSGDIKKGKLRHELFVECMNLAAKMPRQADDDVSDIVSECSNQAWYMANGMSK
jgi:uncharacterized lipoprotein